ncbi:MAG: hypothetical protein HYS81_00900 [Candidatus Aenigmatarchaeota archaeon]|nr:MAG: hypothetical protein HYS81_00900 [Candidatus Aenigmarchaeota archaeon]
MKVDFVYSAPYDSSFYRARFGHYTRDPSVKPFDRELSKTQAFGFTRKLYEIWEPKERAVIEGIERATGLPWKDDAVTCFVVNYAVNGFGYPLTLTTHEGKTEPSRAVLTLVHELAHVNLMYEGPGRLRDYWKTFHERYAGEDVMTRNHIPVHAALAIVLPQTFGEDALVSLKSRDAKDPPYKRAWEIVDNEGAENILKELKDWIKK